MPVHYRLGQSDQDLAACIAVRHEVFVQGQNVPQDEEVDGLDSDAIHYMGEDDGSVIATARVRILEDGTAKVERVAVLESYRGQSIGKSIMLFILEDLKTRPEVRKVKLSSQTHAIPFYERLGFTAYGDEFMDANIPHYDMILEQLS